MTAWRWQAETCSISTCNYLCYWQWYWSVQTDIRHNGKKLLKELSLNQTCLRVWSSINTVLITDSPSPFCVSTKNATSFTSSNLKPPPVLSTHFIETNIRHTFSAYVPISFRFSHNEPTSSTHKKTHAFTRWHSTSHILHNFAPSDRKHQHYIHTNYRTPCNLRSR
jgi:hypothetical protein